MNHGEWTTAPEPRSHSAERRVSICKAHPFTWVRHVAVEAFMTGGDQEQSAGNQEQSTVDQDQSAPLELLIIGDRAPFEEFYRAEYRPLLRLAWALTGRRDLAEDAVREAMLTVHDRWSTVSGYDRPGAYVRRVLLDDLRSTTPASTAEPPAATKDRRDEPRDEPRGEAHEDLPPPDASFWAALRSLPEPQVRAVALQYLEDRAVADIADVVDLAEETVALHLDRGRAALAELLRDQLAEGPA